ncbi:Hypothetical predicted protein [Olea europaea subsp. europaea]|uniref:Uncharacterized protein n=1 Tax=Olea europaea subsp. europaea TaxID=158383 RepID=A0A8S0S1V3_OLEEU|nr:Hypothetical predicted protein [Olea europaea subsp. europaea]
MPDLDLVEALPDNDVAMFGVLYFLTAYLFLRDYKKVVDHFLFVLVEDFIEMNSFPWGKLLFQITLGALRDGFSRRTPQYRLQGMLVAFQAWIYETFPNFEGIVVTKISRVHSRIIVICDLEPLESEMAMPYMNGVQYNKPIQSTSSTESRRRTKCRMERSVENAGTSEKSVPSVLPLMDSNIGQAHSSDDDDDFVAPPLRRQEPSAHGKSPVVEGPIAAHHSQEEPQSRGAQRDDFLSESMSIMISSAMDEIIRWSDDRTSEHGVGQKKAPGVGDQAHHGAGGSEKAQEYMDACFYFIRQITKLGKNVKYRATTTNSWFQIKIKDIFPAFMKDPNVMMSEWSLLEVATGYILPFSSPWADVDYVFMPIIPTNKAH